MKISFFIAALFFIIACNHTSSGEAAGENNSSIPKTLSDSLYKKAIEGHDVGMAKMGEIARYQKILQQQSDSLKGLKNKAGMLPVLDSALQKLVAAEELMNSWMRDFDPDKAGSTEAEKVRYYAREKKKIDTVTAQILRSIENARRVIE
jgi:hypothetical protein